MKYLKVILVAAFCCSAFIAPPVFSEDLDSIRFKDSPVKQAIQNPEWFKLSFLELKDDLVDAREAGKKGIMIYFGQKHCPYCKKFLDANFGKKDIVHYIKKHFDVVGINVRGSRKVTNLAGKNMSEKEFAVSQRANFTPTVMFINIRGKIVLKLVGYQAPYRFRAAMEYVADRHYLKETFRQYLKRAVRDDSLKTGELNKQSYINKTVVNLSRKSRKPLLVMFEQSDCHSCDVLHTSPLKRKKLIARLGKFNVVQLNMWSDKIIVTPKGKRMTIKAWAEKLDINYAPTLVFYSPKGEEIIRSASVIHFFRLNRVLTYILSGAHAKYGSYRAWRIRKQ